MSTPPFHPFVRVAVCVPRRGSASLGCCPSLSLSPPCVFVYLAVLCAKDHKPLRSSRRQTHLTMTPFSPKLLVWFPVKHKGAITAEIYFELTYYALAPVTPVSHMPMQRPIIRPGQPGFIPPGASPYSPPPHMPVYGNVPRPQPPFPVGFQQPPPMVYTHSPNPMPYPVPHQQHPMSPPPRVPGPPNAMGFNPPFHVSSPPPMSGPSGRPNLVPQPYPPNNPGFTSPPRFPAPHQHQPQGGMPMGMPGPGPRPTSRPMGPGQGHGYRPGPGPGPGQNFNARPGHYHNQPGRPSGPMVTPLVQHHNIGSFP